MTTTAAAGKLLAAVPVSSSELWDQVDAGFIGELRETALR